MRDKEKYNAYMKQYMADRYLRRRTEAIALLGGKCVVCGTTENLELDHIDPQKKSFNFAKALAGWAQKRIDEELKKAQLLCETHHLQKSRIDNGVEHGGGLTGKRNCRCELCAPLKNAYVKEFKKNK
jgi:hypothetical protein